MSFNGWIACPTLSITPTPGYHACPAPTPVPFTNASVCLSGATDSSYNGEYDYFTKISKPSGGVWYNSVNRKYLYPWDYGHSVYWKVGDSYLSETAHLQCETSNG